jgi:hypothetical protein
VSRFAALTAIGTIANRLQLPDKKVSILKDALDPNFWTPYVKSSDDDSKQLNAADTDTLVRDLTDHSLQSYALTGTKAASTFLKEQKKGVQNAAMPAGDREQRATVIDQAIHLNAESKRKGALDLLQ